MALAIDGSSPAIATNAGTAVTSASFTPPSGSLLLIGWSGNSAQAAASAPSITDNLGVHLTYTQTDWSQYGDNPAAAGQAAFWWAVVGTSAAMTVTVTNGVSAPNGSGNAVKVWVITGADTVTPIGAHGKSGSTSAASIAQSYTAQATSGWGFIADCDWDVVGAQTAGTGCTVDGSAAVGTSIEYCFARRTTADDVNGNSNTLNVTLPATSTNLRWVYAEILPAATAAGIPYNPQRTIQTRDPGETWWIQKDLRNANLVATAANPLVSPLDSAWQASSRYWHLYGDAADAAPRTWQSLQRNYVSDPTLLVPAAAVLPAAPRTVQTRDSGEVPWLQAPRRDPLLLTTALLENELLGGADDLMRHRSAAAYYDRREVPQQRLYISDPSVYPTVAPTDPLTLAWGVGGTYWLLYNTAALQVDRRKVPQQRRYISDPGLLLTALLENELLGGADDLRRHWMTAAYGDRRVVAPVRPSIDPSIFDVPADTLLLAGGVGGDVWRRANTPAYADRREVPQQLQRETVYFDAGPGVPPLILSWGAGGNLWHIYNRAADVVDRVWQPQQRLRLADLELLAIIVPANANSASTVDSSTGSTFSSSTNYSSTSTVASSTSSTSSSSANYSSTSTVTSPAISTSSVSDG